MEKLRSLAKLSFLPALCEEMIKFLTDYFDNVREQAQGIVHFVVSNFVFDNLALAEAQQ